MGFDPEFKEDIQIFLKLSILSVVEAIFLAVWATSQWLVQRFVSNLHFAGIERVVLVLMQLFLAVVTLVPIVVHAWATVIRAHELIQREKRTSDQTKRSVALSIMLVILSLFIAFFVGVILGYW